MIHSVYEHALAYKYTLPSLPGYIKLLTLPVSRWRESVYKSSELFLKSMRSGSVRHLLSQAAVLLSLPLKNLKTHELECLLFA